MSSKSEPQEMKINADLQKTPIIYTDNIFMWINEDGVVLDIAQRFGPSNIIQVVARIGMSRKHTKKFVEKLTQLIAKSEGKIQTGEKLVN